MNVYMTQIFIVILSRSRKGSSVRLSDLDNKNADVKVVLLQTPSPKLTMFLQDKIKRKVKANSDSILDVENKKDIKKIKDVIGVKPPFSDKWYIAIDLTKMRDSQISGFLKDLLEVIKLSSTCIFFIQSPKYSYFKTIRDTLKEDSGVFDFYITFLKRPDLIYLYDSFVLKSNPLSKSLFDYVVQGYSKDIEAVMDLLLALNKGEEIKSRSDITNICGIGGLSTESFIFSLLKSISGSDKGLKKVMKNRIQAGVELGRNLTYTTFYNYMAKNLLSFIQIKELLISGQVYKTIRNLPNGYDENTLGRQQRYLWRLKEIPMSKLLRLRMSMGSSAWRDETDFLNFIYTYYKLEALESEVLKHGSIS